MAELIVDLVAKGGPYAVIAFLLWDRERVLKTLGEALVDARELRERRADDLVQMVTDYQDNANAQRSALERLTAAVRGVRDE